MPIRLPKAQINKANYDAQREAGVRGFHKQLKDAGADVGTFEEFDKYIKGGYTNRHSLWKQLKNAGADVGTYDEFRDFLFSGKGGKKVTYKSQSKPTAQAKKSGGATNRMAETARNPLAQFGSLGDAQRARRLAMETPSQKAGREAIEATGRREYERDAVKTAQRAAGLKPDGWHEETRRDEIVKGEEKAHQGPAAVDYMMGRSEVPSNVRPKSAKELMQIAASLPAADDEAEEEDVESGFWAGMKNSAKGLYAGAMHFLGEAAKNPGDALVGAMKMAGGSGLGGGYATRALAESGLFDTRQTELSSDVAKRALEKAGASRTYFWQFDHAGSGLHISDDPETRLAYKAYREAGGDEEEALKLLKQWSKEPTVGDKLVREADEVSQTVKETKGVGAWVGEQVVQMIPAALGLAAGAVTKSAAVGRAVGGLGMGFMTGATAGQSMKEAREYGATNDQVWAAGLTDGTIEIASEYLPFDFILKGALKGTRGKVAKKLADAVSKPGSPGRRELEDLLQRGNKVLGGKLLGGKNVKEYLSDVAAEGMGEFSAEFLQTLTPMLYQNPEDYPTLTEAIKNGLAGAAGGVFMGSFFGGIGVGSNQYYHNKRRKAQGGVELAAIKGDEGEDARVVEIVGEDKGKGTYQVYDGEEIRDIAQDDVIERHKYSYEEFRRGELAAERQVGFDAAERRALIGITASYKEARTALEKAQQAYDAQKSDEAKEELDKAKAFFEEAEAARTGMLEAATERGYNADEQERRDIAIEASLEDDADEDTMAQRVAAWDGMLKRIDEDADAMVAARKEENARREHRDTEGKADGSVRPAILKEKDIEGNDQQVYIVDGNVQMMPDGSMVDKASSDNIVVIYNPATGERKQIDPSADTGISSLGEVTTAEQREADIERSRQEYVQSQIDEAQGTVRLAPGQQIVLPTGEEAVVQALFDDGSAVVNMGDGTIQTVDIKELQRIRDEKAAADYRQRHGITEEPAAQQPEASTPAQPQADGRVVGAPTEYNEGMELTVRDDNGEVKTAMVMGRVRAVHKNGKMDYVPDADGNLIEYWMDDDVHHENEAKLASKVVSHVAPQQPEAETTPTTTEPQAPQTDEERVIREGIADIGEGLRDAVNEQAAGVRENDINNWLRKPSVADAMRKYGEGAQSVEEVVQRALADNPNEETKAALGDIMRFDSSKQLVQGYISQPQPAQPAEAPARPTEQPTAEPMPVREDGEEDWQATTPERAHAYIFNEAGLSRSEGNEFIAAQTQAAQSALVKAKSAQMPRVGTNIKKYNEAKAKRQEKIDEAQRVLDYWQQVRNIQNDIQREENERRAADDAVRHDEAVAEAQAEFEARKQAEAERKAVGNENPMPAITEKWNNATKVDGHRDEIMLPDGTPLKGHYVLHESGASSPSHNPETWQKTDGFPMDANDNSVNDRDYERDHDAQEHTQSIARQYDQRALQSVPVVSNDGVVLSGNGRTMAGELAARDNTDGAYVNYLKEYAPKFGFTAEQVGAMQHPRVSFVPDEAMPYTAETFAKFNQQEMKSQNKTEQAVKLGKTVSDDSFKGIVRTINGYDTLGDFYNDAWASLGAVYDLHDAGVVPQAQLAEMVDGVRGQEKLSAVGREFLENMLIGKAFESDPEVVRMLTAEPAMRQTVITALGEIVDNIALGGDWSLQGELADAVKLCFDARQGGAKYGEIVSTYARQGVLFADPDELQTVADFNNATMLMLADVLNDKRVTLLKTTLQLYNNNARQSASGQTDLFAGGIQSREDILRDVITFINENYGKRKEIEAARAEAVERRKAERVQQDGIDGESRTRNEEANTEVPSNDGRGSDGSPARREQGGLAQTESLNYQLSDEVDENGHQFVLNSEGTIEFGYIGNETGLTPAPILLSEGVITNPKTNAGYGLLHIEARHGEQIREAGYGSVLEFVEEVAKNYEVIRKGNDRDGRETYMLLLPGRHNNTLMVELSGDGTYWNINTAGIFKTSYGANRTDVYNRHTTANQSAETDEASLSGEQSGTTPSTRMNAPAQTVDNSAGKGSENSATVQEKTEKVAENQTPNAVQAALATAEKETDTNPTEAQKEAGNYKKGHVKIDGYDVTIENPKGSVRRGTDASGKQWEQEMQNTYGYIRGTEGVDGDHIDVFFSEDPSQGDVFVVDQVNKDGSFDEHKVMYGFPDIESARKAYLSNYEDGWQGLGAITPVSKEEFKKWIRSSHRKTKPFAEYSNVKPLGDTQLDEQPKEPTVKAGEDYVSAAERIAKEHEVKRTAAHFAEETQEEAAAFDKRVPEMDDAELLAYMQEDGKGDVNKAYHPNVYDEYDYRHDDEQMQSYDDTLVRLNESGTTLEQAEEMLANIQKDVSRLVTEDRAMLLGQEEALQEYIAGLEKEGERGQSNSLEGGQRADGLIWQQKADGRGGGVLSRAERALRDGLVGLLRMAGIKVSMDAREGQRIIDMANGGATLSKGQKRALETASLTELSEAQHTVVSNADGAKVQQNLRNLAKELENKSNRSKTFLGDVAKALGAQKHGSNSQYVTIEAKNGNIVTIRLSNHNASVSSFDNHNEANGISIVLSNRKNNGINNNGEAHLVEFFYSEVALRRAEGKPLAAIVRSIEQALYSGEYKDTTGLAEREEVNLSEVRHQKVDPVFYSNARRAVEGIKQEKATPAQWLAMLQKQGGLKAGEDKWLGLSEWLSSSQEKNLTKQQVLDFIEENEVQLEEVEYADVNDSSSSPRFKELQEEFEQVKKDVPRYWQEAEKRYADFEREMQEKYGNKWRLALTFSERAIKRHLDNARYVEGDDINETAYKILCDKYGDDFSVAFYYDGSRFAISNEDAASYFLGIKPIDDTRLDYTTNGLKNKREVAITVPEIEPYKEHDTIHFGDAGEGRAVVWVRFGETTDADGRRVLVIDEIQSKRHQDGREMGYVTEEDKEARSLHKAYVEARTAANEYETSLQRKYGLSNISDAEITEEERVKRADLWKRAQAARDADRSFYSAHPETRLDGGVPDAPFEKNWHELAMKRMLRLAAEEGFDKVAWTTGAQQAERYNIGDVVEKIVSYNYPAVKDAEGRESRKVEIRLTSGDVMTMRVNAEGRVIEGRGDTEGKELSDIVGKDLARRIMEGDGRDGSIFDAERDIPAKVIEGDGLLIGGDGMKGFYDQMLPRFMDKYGKKWGVKTQDVSLNGLNGQSSLTMHAVDVTPEMKQSVMEGQPMFFRTADGQAYGFTLDGRIYIDPRIATAETPIHEYAHLWAQALREGNPEEWANVVGLMKESGLWEEIKRRYPELKTDDALAEEVLAHYSGRRGAERLREEMREQMSEEKDYVKKAEIAQAFNNILRAIERFWEKFADFLHIHYKSAEEVADRVMADLLRGVNPQEVTESSRSSRSGQNTIAEKEVRNVVASSTKETLPTTRQEAIATIPEGGKVVKNKDQGVDVRVGRKALRHSALHGEADVYKAFGKIDEMIAEAVKIGEAAVAEDEAGHTHSTSIFYVPVNVDGVQYSARMVLKQYENKGIVLDELSLYNVSMHKEKTLSHTNLSASEGSGAQYDSVQSGYKVKDLIHTTQAEDRKLLGLGENGELRFGKGDVASDEKTLLGVHNISEEKLKKSIKSGGLANPSLAVIDTNTGIHSGFGEISLIPKSSLIDSKTGRNAGTYTGDAYTSTYPYILRELTKQGRQSIERIAREAAGGDADLELHLINNLNGFANGDTSRLHLLYLLEKGFNPEIKQKSTKHSHDEYEELMKIFPDGEYPREMTKEQNDALLSLMMRKAEDDAERRTASISDAEKRERAMQVLIDLKRSNIADENGNVWFAKGETFFHDVKRDESVRQHPQVDWYATDLAADNRVATEGMSEDYAKWKEGLFVEGDFEEQLFAGFDRYGNRKYVPNTVENASRLMNKLSETNSYDSGGLNATRSGLLTKMKTLSDIRKNKDLLQGDEAYDKKQEEMSSELYDIIKQLSDMQKISDNSFANIDYAESRLQEAITKRDPIGYLNKEYGYSIDKNGEFSKQVKSFIQQVKRMPAKYFETKFKRPVMLNEFAVAVVPETTSQEVVKALQDAGLDVRTYDASDYKTADENRHKAAMEAVSGRDDIMFQKVGEPIDSGQGQYAKVETTARSGVEDRDMMRSAVQQMGEKLYTDINIIEDVNEITHPNAEIEANRRRAKGWYDRVTRQVYVVLPNNRDIDDAKATVAHEVIAHKGLRELIGEERYEAFLDEAYEHLRGDLKSAVDTAAQRMFMDAITSGPTERTFEDFRRVAVDELFGRLAEKPFEEFTAGERTLWEKLKETVRRLLDKFLGSLKLPSWFELGDNELRYILWRSKERLERGREHPIDLARDIVKREELGLGEPRSSRMPANEHEDMNGGAGVEDTALYSDGDAPLSVHINGLRFSHNLRGGAMQIIIEDREGLERLRGIVSEGAFKAISKSYEHEREKGCYLLDSQLAVVFAEKIDDIREGEAVWAHEQAHYVFEQLSEEEQARYGTKCLQWIKHNAPEVYENIVDNYPQSEWHTEACAYTISEMVMGQGFDNFMQSSLSGEEDIVKFATFYRNTISHGKSERQESASNRLQQPAAQTSSDFSGPRDTERQAESRDSGEGERRNRYVGGNGSDIEELFKDQSLGLQERITLAKLRLAAAHAADKQARDAARRAVSESLQGIRRAMSAQRAYDRTTVKRVADLARVLLKTGYLSGLGQADVMSLLSAVKNSTGREDTAKSVEKVLDIMIAHQLRAGEAALERLERIKGSRVDAKGVEVQGQLDAAGQTVMKAFKKARHWSEKDIEDAMGEAENRMGHADATIADEAALEYTALQLALDYVNSIKASKTEEDRLSKELQEAKEDYAADSGRFGSREAYREFVRTVESALRQNKIERAEAYYGLVGRLTGDLSESMARAAAFREEQKQRVREIQHNANSDMEGRSAREHGRKDTTWKAFNNFLGNTLFAPMATFVEMMRLFGRKSFNGEGYLFDRFVRGGIDARQQEIRGVRKKYATLDEKAREVFGKKGRIKSWGDVIRWAGRQKGMPVRFWDGGEMVEHELGQGNMMYIYMVNKMLDGQMKLRKMGITEEDVAAVEERLDQRLKELADWLQEEFLVASRTEYNETHKRVFGASMAAIEDYFPLVILANARADKPEDLDNPRETDGISTTTGAIIKRRRNGLALDLTRADALSVVLDHVAKMEHWNAFAEYNRDLNTLRTYKRFRNQVMNMTTIYGNGKELWEKFNDVCQLMTGTYRPKQSKLDKGALVFAQGVTAAKVAFRTNTALKQLLSLPAFASQTRLDHLVKNVSTPWISWQWCMENLPMFEERWKSRVSGDPRLIKSKMDWRDWHANTVQKLARAGMLPNAFIDALTVSIGAHAVYKTKLAQYKRDGFTDEQAHQRAIQDAEIAYNQTQQSSEGGYVSTMQTDRSWLSVLFTVFRNASMGYQRRLHAALRNLGRNLNLKKLDERIAFEKKKLVRAGVDEAKAEKAVWRKLFRQYAQDIIDVGMFGYGLQLLWNFGGYWYYLLFGDDDDEKEKMIDDIEARSMFGWLEGFTGGDVLSDTGAMLLTGEGNPGYLSKDMPLTADLLMMYRKAGAKKYDEALNDMFNIAISSGIGVNPQSFTDFALGCFEASHYDADLAHETAIFVGRILQTPKSQLDKMYLDDLDMTGKEARRYSPKELAERYAWMQVRRGRLVTPWSWDDEELLAKKGKPVIDAAKAKVTVAGDARVNEQFIKYDDEYKEVRQLEKEAKETVKEDYIAGAQKFAELHKDEARWSRYEFMKAYGRKLDELVKKYLSAESVQDAAKCRQDILDYKRLMVDGLEHEDKRGDVAGELMEMVKVMQQPNR